MSKQSLGRSPPARTPRSNADLTLPIGPIAGLSTHASEHTDLGHSAGVVLHDPASRIGTSRRFFGVRLLALADSREHDRPEDRRTSLLAGSAFAEPRRTPIHQYLLVHSQYIP